ncbi:unnamed protein product, partial [Rotaria sp. Silwood2]
MPPPTGSPIGTVNRWTGETGERCTGGT